MPKRKQDQQNAPGETTELRNRLEETEETLRAIRQYMVDAFVVTDDDGEQVVTLNDADFPYRMMVESMNEGAVTLIPDGTIFYCNPRFGEMVESDGTKLIGVQLRDLIVPEDRSAFDVIFKEAGQHGSRGEFCLKSITGKCTPVQLSVYQLPVKGGSGISIIATDITERIQAEKKIHSLASKLAVAEQEERHRISQILHDDLQQRLFAIKTQLSFLKVGSEKSQFSPEMQSNLDQVQRWLSDAIRITRSLSIDLSPVILQGEGLAEAIRWLASQMKEQYGLDVNLQVQEDLNFRDAHMRVLLFQAVREALFNIVKHAGTLQTDVTLEQINGHGRITVDDQGKGFDAETVLNDPAMAHGLLIVRDRLNLLGCHIEVSSKPGEGTRIIIESPQERISA